MLKLRSMKGTRDPEGLGPYFLRSKRLLGHWKLDFAHLPKIFVSRIWTFVSRIWTA